MVFGSDQKIMGRPENGRGTARDARPARYTLLGSNIKETKYTFDGEEIGRKELTRKLEREIREAQTFTSRSGGFSVQGKISNISPDGKNIAFVRENDLYTYNIKKKQEKRLTYNDSETILNGTLSWVYWEEIFGRQDIGYWWSDDSRALAYLQTDESPVTKMHYVHWKPEEPKLITQRYPKAGTANPIVKLGIIEISTPKTKWVDLESFEYLCRVKWLPDNKRLSIQTMNRAQTKLDLFFVDRATGKNIDKIIPIAIDVYNNSIKKISQKELNECFLNAIS